VLTRREGSITVLIEDDGRGFTPGDTREEGLGILGMQERIALVGGQLTVESSPGGGTTLAVEAPLP
jgi:signal transduction histidine kinase